MKSDSGESSYHGASRQGPQPCVSRSRFCESIGGSVSSNVIIRNGLETYIDYVVSQITNFSATSDGTAAAFVPQTLSRPDERVNQLLDIATKVAVMLVNMDKQCSLEDLAKELIKLYHSKESPANEERDTRCAQYLVFHCIGWITMCYIPTSDLANTFLESETHAAFRPGSCKSSYTMSKRPLGAVLREFMPIRCRPDTPYKIELDSAGTILTVASLNYYSLYHIGKLSIEWTEKLSDHCLLDVPGQHLKLFRFPAFCAQAITGNKGEHILTRILQAHSCRKHCQAMMPDAVHHYLYEVLLSYRLLFGGNKGSRKLFHAEAGSKASRNLLCDPVLYLLCGRKDVSEIASLIPGFEDAGTFDTRTDFPELGERLRLLQEYSASQRPTRLKDVWNDRRDAHQNFTFWAVIIIGAASIFLSFLEVVISIAQLAVAVRQT